MHDAMVIFRAGLAAVEPRSAIRRALIVSRGELLARDLHGDSVRLPLVESRPVWIVGAGKAAAAMAGAVEELLGERVRGGLVVVKEGHEALTERVDVVTAGHPEPDERSLSAAARMRGLLARLEAEALVVALISGGGSALLAEPAAGLSLSDKQAVTARLLRCGATIQELNLVRRALSQIKGGGLARAARPATVLSLIISDVVGDDLATVASGPTVLRRPKRSAARAMLERYGAWHAAPPAVRQFLERQVDPLEPQPPRSESLACGPVHNLLLAHNALCLAACADRARQLGYETEVMVEPVIGEARERGRELAEAAKLRAAHSRPRPVCLVSGGETTVRVEGPGRGGRNQELALAAAISLAGQDNMALLSAGTDGTDHVDQAAGAVALGDTVARGHAAGLDAEACLRANDSFAFFSAVDNLVVTGPTLTNVNDVQLMLID